MALNNLGLGLTFMAKDLASKVIADVAARWVDLSKAEREAAKEAVAAAAEQVEASRAFGEGMAKAGASAAVFGAAGLSFLGVATAKAYDMEEALKLVATRTTEAKFPMEEMNEVAGKLATQFGSLPTEQARAMFQAVGAGATTAAQATQLMTGANALAKASNTELGQSLGIVSQLLKAYGLSFDKAGAAADAVFIASRNANTTVGELGAMLEHFAPSAARAGVSMNELLAGIGALSKSGLTGRPAMAGMKAVIDALIQPSKDAKMEAARLGIAFGEAAVKAKGLPSVLASITSSGKMNATTLEKLFGSVEAGTAAMALMKNGGKDLADSLMEIQKGGGAAGKAAESLVTPLDRLKSVSVQAMMKIGAALIPVVNAVASFGLMFLNAFMAIPKPVIMVATVLAAAGFAAIFVAGTVVALAGAFIALDVSLGPVLVALGAVAAIAAPLFVLLLAGGAAIAGMSYLVKKAFDENLGGVRDSFLALWSKVKLVWEGLEQLFTQGGFSGAVRAEVDKAENSGLKQFLIEIFMWGSRVGEFFRSMGETVVAEVAPAWQELSGAFRELGEAISQALGGENDPSGNAAKWRDFASAGAQVGHVLAMMASGVIRLTAAVVSRMGTAIAEVRSFVTAMEDLWKIVQVVIPGIGPLMHLLGKSDAVQVPGVPKVAAFSRQAPVVTSSSFHEGGLTEGGASGGISGPPRASAGPTSAAVARAQGQAGDGAAFSPGAIAGAVRDGMKAAPAPVVQSKVDVYLDGDKIADAMAARQQGQGVRGFAPLPAPAG